MGLLDKLLGRGKQATGDLVGDSSLHDEGVHQEQAGIAADKADAHEEAAVEAHIEEAEHRQQAD
jgi:uncharacterized protein YjbJ (UPF0337 family)